MDNYSSRRHGQHVKLKDSCDPCSTSKVRCTKEKPTCARCAKLNHQCFYSPARRIGRPNRACSNSYGQSEASSYTSSRSQQRQQQNTDHNKNNNNNNDQQPLSDLTQPVASSISVSTATLQQPPPSRVSPPFYLPSPPRSSASPCPSNCFDHVLELLSNLDQNKGRPLVSEAACLNDAIKVLSRVLICPCSQSLDVALLAAAGCHSVLDLVEGMIRSPSTSPPPPPSQRAAVDGYAAAGTDPGNHNVVMSELRRVANLVVQFTSRYYGMIEEEHRETLLGLAGDLKARFQTVIDEATSCGGAEYRC